MIILRWIFTHLAPSLHWEFSMSNIRLKTKRVPNMSMFIWGIALLFKIDVDSTLIKWLSRSNSNLVNLIPVSANTNLYNGKLRYLWYIHNLLYLHHQETCLSSLMFQWQYFLRSFLRQKNSFSFHFVLQLRILGDFHFGIHRFVSFLCFSN